MIIQYFKANAEYTLILISSLAICAIIIALIVFFYKKSKSNIANELTKNNEICENLIQNQNILPQQADFSQSASAQAEFDLINYGDIKDNSAHNFESNTYQIVTASADWIIYQDGSEFFAQLSNGNECFLQTERYSSLSGIKSAIETVKNNVQAENYAIDLNNNGQFIFKVFSTAKRMLCISKEYHSLQQCESAFKQINKISKTAKIITFIEK
jgi:uncharacterized protein YegP (UPF0339 family)